MRGGDVEWEKLDGELFGQFLGIVLQPKDVLVLGDRRHGACWLGRRQSKHSRAGHGVGISVEFGHGRDVPLHVDGAAHDNELLYAEEGLWVFGRGHGDICKGSYCADGDRACGLFLENAQDLLVRRKPGRSEVLVVAWVIARLGDGTVFEESFPCVCRGQMGLLVGCRQWLGYITGVKGSMLTLT